MSELVVHVPMESHSWPRQAEWVRLDSLCVGVYDCPHSTPALTSEGPLVVRSQDVRSGVFRWDEAGHVSEATYSQRIARAEPQYGDLFYSREGTYFGLAAEVPLGMRVCLGQRMVLIRPRPERLNARFLRLWLNSPVLSRHIHGFRDGTVAERLNMPTIRGLPVPLLRVDEQDGIAVLLGSLDDKIELNRRMNETLEAMAQAIFRDWFVDFGPTRRKLEGATDSLTIMGGLVHDTERAQALADLFPATLSDDGLPEGWNETTLESYASLNPESWSAKTAPDQVEYVDLANTKWGTIESTSVYSWKNAPSRARRIVRSGDTIVGTVRPGNGSYAFVGRSGLTASTGFAVLRPKQPAFNELVNCAATSPDNIQRLEKFADGGAYPAVKPEVVVATPLPLVPGDVASAFSDFVGSMFERIESSKEENRTLAATRDLLLPKLMSGEIYTSGAEDLMEAAQ